MERILSVVVFGFLVWTSPAWGAAEFPYLEARLVELSRAGHELSLSVEKRLTANRNRDSKIATSFTFTEMFSPPPCTSRVCPMRPSYLQSRNFKVVRVTQDRCGSRKYLAQSEKAVLTVVDHETQRCDRYNKYRWQVTVMEAAQKRPRLFAGDPEPVYVVETCQEKLANWACIMLYLPMDCRAETIDGGKTPIQPIFARGSNACFAGIQIKQDACFLGIDPDRFEEGDIVCTPADVPDPEAAK